MKAKTPSLLFYFLACLCTILFNTLGQEDLKLYAKALVVPTIFIYYFITNNYRIDFFKAGIFLFSFIGDIFILLDFDNSETVTVLSFLTVNVLFIFQLSSTFKKIKYKVNVPTLVAIVTVMLVLSTTILSLRFENMRTDFSIIIVYSIALSIIICIAVVKYIARGTFTQLNLLLMSICFLLSDVFYVLNSFYLSLSVFSDIEIATQVFSYYFMTNYFIGNDKSLRKLNNN